MKFRTPVNINKTKSQYLIVVIAALVFCLGLYLRLLFLQLPYWFDEANTIYYINQSFARMMEFIRHDFSPPLYHILLRGWVKAFGQSEEVSGWFSLILNILTLPLIYFFGRKVANKQVGLFAAIIFWLSPLFIFQSTNTRMYSLETLLGVLSCLFLWQIFQDGQWHNWLSYIIFTLLGLYTHTTFLFLVAAQFFTWIIFYYVLKCPHVLWKKWFLAQLVILIGYLLWLPVFLRQLFQNQSPIYWTDFVAKKSFFSAGDILANAVSSPDYSLVRMILSLAVIYLVYLSLRPKSSDYEVKVDRQSLFFLINLIVIPLMVVYFTDVLIDKFIIYIFPLFFLILAIGIYNLKFNFPMKFLLTSSFLILLSVSTLNSFEHFNDNSGQFLTPTAAKFLESNIDQSKSNIILAIGHVEKVLLDYYYQGTTEIIGAFPPSLIENNDQEVSAIIYNGRPVIDENNVNEVYDIVSEYDSVWLVSFPDQLIYDPLNLVEVNLSKNCRLAVRFSFPGHYTTLDKIEVFNFIDCLE